MSFQLDQLEQLLSNIDFNTADRGGLESSVLKVLVELNLGAKNTPTPIAPLADPIKLDDLVGDNFRWSVGQVNDLAKAVDLIYSELIDINNTFMSDLENAEKVIAVTSDAVQNVTSLTQDQAKNYVWISDSFNDNVYVDLNKSSALVDTDIGSVVLNPSTQQTIDLVNVNIERERLLGVPGCNMLLLDTKSLSNVDVSPIPTLEKSEVKDISNLTDNNNQTWFEIERNLIPKIQPIRRSGRALVYGLGSPKKDIIKETSDYDWRAAITYPDGFVDLGPDKKGVNIAEFLEDSEDPTSSSKYDTSCEVRMDLINPQPLSDVKIIPFIRDGQGQVLLEKLSVICEGQSILLARNVDLTIQAKSTQTLQKEILRRTGSSSIGSVFSVPTNRNVTSVVATFKGKPYQVKTGLAHPFREEYIEQKTKRRYLITSSTNTTHKWIRKPLSETPIGLSVSKRELNLLGTTQPLFNQLFQLGGGIGSLLGGASNDAKILNLLGTTSGQNQLTQIAGLVSGVKGLGSLGSAIGKAGSFLTKSLPYIGGALAVSDILKTGFAVTTTRKTLNEENGYDIFNGWRSYVAIRDISLNRTTYTDYSEVVSVKRDFPVPVKKIGLIVEYDIPSDWGQGDWMSFFLSVDGNTWSNVKSLSETTLEQSFTPNEPSQTVYFKAVIRGNPLDPFKSPKLKHYTLMGLPN